jgi:hypothetical protein
VCKTFGLSVCHVYNKMTIFVTFNQASSLRQVSLLTCLKGVMVRISAGTPDVLTEVFLCIFQTLEVNVKLGHRFFSLIHSYSLFKSLLTILHYIKVKLSLCLSN